MLFQPGPRDPVSVCPDSQRTYRESNGKDNPVSGRETSLKCRRGAFGLLLSILGLYE